VLEQRAVALERLRQFLGPVRRAEAAPGDEVGARRDRGGRVDLEERQPLDDAEQARGAFRVEQLRADRDAAGLGLREVVDGVAVRGVSRARTYSASQAEA